MSTSGQTLVAANELTDLLQTQLHYYKNEYLTSHSPNIWWFWLKQLFSIIYDLSKLYLASNKELQTASHFDEGIWTYISRF